MIGLRALSRDLVLLVSRPLSLRLFLVTVRCFFNSSKCLRVTFDCLILNYSITQVLDCLAARLLVCLATRQLGHSACWHLSSFTLIAYFTPPYICFTGKLLLLANGAYGLRMKTMCDMHGIPCTLVECSDDEYPSASATESLLASDPAITHVAMVHSETTSGIVNNVQEIGSIVSRFGKSFIVDAMSSFGGIPISLDACHIDYIVSSSNKCIEGIPGFSFAICRKEPLEAVRGSARVLSLDIHRQLEGLEKDGQFRFTPPTHSLLAFHQALAELEQEGGVKARHARYTANQIVLQKGMAALGFEPYMPKEKQGCIITSYRYPTDAGWNFTTFYTKLSDRGFVIYPGKVSKADCFRIGHIGRLFPEDSEALLVAMDEVCKEMRTAKYAETAQSAKI